MTTAEQLRTAASELAARDSDHAFEENGVGFNKSDSWYGHSIAAIPAEQWTPQIAAHAHRMLRKYRAQLARYGVDFDAIPAPAVVEDEAATRQAARTQVWDIRGEQMRTRVERPTQPTIERTDDGSFIVTFRRFDRDALDVFKAAVPGRRFDGMRKVWTVPATSTDQLGTWALEAGAEGFAAVGVDEAELARRAAANAAAAASAEQARGQRRNLSNATDALIDVDGLGGELLPFQRAGVKYALEVERGFLADEMGLGKTVQALAAIHAADAYPAVIVCPNLVKLKWCAEATKWLPGRTISLIEGNGASGTQRVAPGVEVAVNDYDADVLVFNYDKLPRWLEGAGKNVAPKADSALAKIVARRPAAVIFDESHYVKNHKAKRTAGLAILARSARIRLGLSGTPLVNRPQELIAQLKILGRLDDFGGFWKFAARYCGAERGRYGLDLSGAANLAELNTRLRETCYVRRLKRDVLTELPAKRRTTLAMPLSNGPEYRRAERDVVRFVGEVAAADADFRATIADLPADEQADRIRERRASAEAAAARAEVLVRINALRQVAARGKMDAVIEWVDDFVGQGDKLVVFAHHREIQNGLLEALTAHRPAAILGEYDAQRRAVEVERFQTDDDCKLIIVSTQAGGVGIELTAASNVAFVELEWRPADHDQAEDRCYGRINDPHGLNAWYLLAENTIDEDMAALIDAKRDVVDAATDGRTGTTGDSILGSLLTRLAQRAG